MVSVQMLSELEEIIQFKLVPERREAIKRTWWNRLQVSDNIEWRQHKLQQQQYWIEPQQQQEQPWQQQRQQQKLQRKRQRKPINKDFKKPWRQRQRKHHLET